VGVGKPKSFQTPSELLIKAWSIEKNAPYLYLSPRAVICPEHIINYQNWIIQFVSCPIFALRLYYQIQQELDRIRARLSFGFGVVLGLMECFNHSFVGI